MPRRPDCQPQTLTVRQTAAVFGLRQRTAYKYIRRGLIPSFRMGTRILVLRDVVDTLLDSGRFAPPAREPEF